MVSNKKLYFLISFILVSLFLTEAPYINVFFAGKIWIAYLLLFLYLFPVLKLQFIFPLTLVFLFAIILLTFLNLSAFAESIGVMVFVSLCLMFGIIFYKFIKES